MTSAALPKAEGWRLARLLARHGWALARRVVRGETRFVVTRRGGVVKAGGRASRPPSGTALAAGGVVAELALESPEGAAAGAKVSVVPDFRLRLVGSHALTEAERRGISDLSSGLCLLLDAMKPKAAASLVQAQTESHEGAQGFDLLLRTTLACNQRCPFCCVPLSRKRIDPASLEAELSALARRLGSRGTLTLSGGEPLADPRLPGLLESARAKGIRRFVLQTNAVGLERPGMIEKLTELGVRHFFVSFHSHKSAAYDRITGSKGLYPRAVRALMKLFSGGGYGVTCNVVVNAWNYRDLPGLMIFLAGLARKAGRRRMGSLDVFFSMINGVGVAKAPRSAVDLAEAAPYLRKAVSACEEAGLKVQPFAAEAAPPLCLLSRPGRYAARRALSQDRVSYVEGPAVPSGERRSACASGDLAPWPQVIGRVKAAACGKCRFDSKCLGVPVEYARIFGLEALCLQRRGGPQGMAARNSGAGRTGTPAAAPACAAFATTRSLGTSPSRSAK